MFKELEYVEVETVLNLIHQEYPNETFRSITQRVHNVSEDRFYKIKQQQHMSLSLADEILTSLDINYLLATGDIPIYSKAEEKIVKLEKELERAKAKIKEAESRASHHRTEARAAKAKLYHLQKKSAGN